MQLSYPKQNNISSKRDKIYLLPLGLAGPVFWPLPFGFCGQEMETLLFFIIVNASMISDIVMVWFIKVLWTSSFSSSVDGDGVDEAFIASKIASNGSSNHISQRQEEFNRETTILILWWLIIQFQSCFYHAYY